MAEEQVQDKKVDLTKKRFVLVEFDDSGDIIGIRMQGVSVFNLLTLVGYIEVNAKADIMNMREATEQHQQLQSVVPKGILKP